MILKNVTDMRGQPYVIVEYHTEMPKVVSKKIYQRTKDLRQQILHDNDLIPLILSDHQADLLYIIYQC